MLRSGVTCYLLGVLYACTLVYGCRRLFVLRWSRTQRTIDTPLLFVASIVCALLVRFMSFLNLSVLAYEGVTVEAQTGPPLQSAQAFFSSVLAVFFNVGDWIAISSYLLLIVVWLELMQHARKHFYSQMRMRRNALIVYLISNTAMWILQLGLYVGVFTAPNSNPSSIFQAIYSTVACLNIGIPIGVGITYAVYSVQFAGFPYRSHGARAAWVRISWLLGGWTLGRLMWAGMSIVSADNFFVQGVANVGDWLFTVVTVTLFVLAELIPFIASLGTDVLGTFGPLHRPQSRPGFPSRSVVHRGSSIDDAITTQNSGGSDALFHPLAP